MRSRPRMARRSRSSARSMSRIRKGSQSWSSEGARKRRASSGAASPRFTSTCATGLPTPSAADKTPTARGFGAGSVQRAGFAIAPSVLGKIPAQRVAALFEIVFIAEPRIDLFFQVQKLLVPVGLHFVHVQAGMMVKCEFERTGHALEDAQFADSSFVLAPLFPGEFAVVELFGQFVEIGALEFRRGKQDQSGSRFARDIQKRLIVGMVFHIPEHHGEALQPARAAAENGEAGRFQIFEDLALQRV